MFAFWYDSKWIFQIGLPGGFLGEPYFVKGLAGNAAREVGVKLCRSLKLDEISSGNRENGIGERKSTDEPQSLVGL